MDASDLYVKMCEKAEEIQALRPVGKDWELGDFYYYKSTMGKDRDFDGVAGSSNGYDDYFITHESGEIFLPRQDQLQEMILIIDEYAIGITKLLGYFNDFALSVCPKFTTMEQLWLAFLMKGKYGKTWDGEDWRIGCPGR